MRRNERILAERVERDIAPDQPRLYRARLFEGSREVLGDEIYPVVLDLTAGFGLHESAHRLDNLLRSLLRIANAKRDKIPLYHLDVREWDNKARLFSWPVTWDHDEEP